MNYNKLSLRLPEGEALTYLADRALAWQTRAEKALKTDEVVIGKYSIYYFVHPKGQQK